MTLGRILICSKCRQDWDVIEIPAQFIDHKLYVCPDCLRAVDQLEIHDLKVDRREYDPSIAKVPY